MYLLMSSRSIVDGNEPEDSTLGIVNVLGQFEKISQCVDAAIEDMDRIMKEKADMCIDTDDIEGYEKYLESFYQEIVHEDLLNFDKEINGQAYLGELEQNIDDCIDQVDYFVYKI